MMISCRTYRYIKRLLQCWWLTQNEKQCLPSFMCVLYIYFWALSILLVSTLRIITRFHHFTWQQAVEGFVVRKEEGKLVWSVVSRVSKTECEYRHPIYTVACCFDVRLTFNYLFYMCYTCMLLYVCMLCFWHNKSPSRKQLVDLTVYVSPSSGWLMNWPSGLPSVQSQ